MAVIGTTEHYLPHSSLSLLFKTRRFHFLCHPRQDLLAIIKIQFNFPQIIYHRRCSSIIQWIIIIIDFLSSPEPPRQRIGFSGEPVSHLNNHIPSNWRSSHQMTVRPWRTSNFDLFAITSTTTTTDNLVSYGGSTTYLWDGEENVRGGGNGFCIIKIDCIIATEKCGRSFPSSGCEPSTAICLAICPFLWLLWTRNWQMRTPPFRGHGQKTER